ncbi:MAG TPA: hypothetical protein VN441_03885, partial [Syntrophomonas sp.]|nr:hypothetical protein [Syntrophomonas sp.]
HCYLYVYQKKGEETMKVQLEKIKDEIVGLRPVYTDTGNATLIYLRQGEAVDPRGLRAVLAALARIYAVDMGAQRSQLETALQRQGMMPFYLGPERVFVPLKMRRALAERDAVYGYVDVRCMEEASACGSRGCRLRLLDGREIEILSSRATVEQCRTMGCKLLEMLRQEKGADPQEKMMVGAVLHVHQMFRVLERRLIHIEEMIAAEGESRYG